MKTRTFHKVVGLAIALVLAFLAISGVLLHHPALTKRLLGEPREPGALADPTTALAVDPASSSHVFVGTRRGVFESTDGGRTFHDVLLRVPADNVVSLAFGRGAPALLLVALRGGGVFVSSDGGSVWEDAGLPREAVDERVAAAAFGASGEIVVRTRLSLYAGKPGGSWRRLEGAARGGSRLLVLDALHEGEFPGRAWALVEDVAALGLVVLIVSGITIAAGDWRRGRRSRR